MAESEAEKPLSGAGRPGRSASSSDRGDRGATIADMLSRYSSTREPELRERISAANAGLAIYLARRFANRGQSLEDLTAAAQRALVASIDEFDPAGEVDFPTHATTSIVYELKRSVKQRGWAEGAPRHTLELYRTLDEVLDQLSETLGRPPTVANLAAAVDASEEEVLEALEEGQAYRFASAAVPHPS